MKFKMNITSSGDGLNRDALTRDQTYIAIITEDFCSNENCLGEMRDAFAMKLPMYAILKAGIKVPENVKKMPWKKIFIFTAEKQIPVIAELLKLEFARSTLKEKSK